MSALSSGHRPTTLKQGALYRLTAAFLHVTAACEKKWEPKWKPGAHGGKQEDSRHKANSNNAKRKKRADSKWDVLKWRFLNFSLSDLFEIHGSHGVHSSKAQRQQNDSKTYSHRWSSENGRSSKKKGHKRNLNEEEPSFEGFKSGPFHFYWQCDTNDQNQWWDHTGEYYTSWQGQNSYNSRQTHKKRLNTETTVGSVSDRKALGLCPTGPLTVEELKKAFRLSALKWHPDRHQGSGKVIAEEKFKRCGTAYKSLLDALASA